MTSTKRLTYEYVKEYIESFGYTLLEKEYKNNKTKMKIRCDKGHVYYSHFNNFKNVCRCPECKKIKHTESQKFTYKEVKEFIESIGYTLLEDTYIKGTIKMKMICDHGHEIKMTFKSLRRGYRCPKCGKIHMAEKRKFTYEYVKEYIESQGYELLSNNYKNSRIKLKMKCDKGHVFEMCFHNFKNENQRCSVCRYEKSAKSNSNSYEYVKEYIESYGYKLLSYDYKNNREKLLLKCNKNHVYEAAFTTFKQGYRCPHCNNSRGENEIVKFLKSNNIEYKIQYKFDDCKLHHMLPFDFYLPEHNICIEYDGVQHYKPIEHFGGMDGFIDTKIRDTIKTVYCENNNIKLLRIPYWEFDNIESILKEKLLIK